MRGLSVRKLPGELALAEPLALESTGDDPGGIHPVGGGGGGGGGHR